MLERLVPFSCKGRGFCPNCGGRRMTERAAHLLDAVLPWVPVRQWVLTMPYRLRYLLAWDHRLARAVLGVYARALLDLYRRRAQRAGLADDRTGTVTVIQCFGSGLNLNIHFHTLVLDGVFAEAGGRHDRFPSGITTHRRGGGSAPGDGLSPRAPAAGASRTRSRGRRIRAARSAHRGIALLAGMAGAS
jgi:hypothetical protein